jgi:hypothetical protein
MTFDRVTFTARTLVRLITLSAELFEDADRVALLGSGTPPEPRGVLNHCGVTLTSHGANGANITNYDWYLDAIGAVLAANFEPNAHIQPRGPRRRWPSSRRRRPTPTSSRRPGCCRC